MLTEVAHARLIEWDIPDDPPDTGAISFWYPAVTVIGNDIFVADLLREGSVWRGIRLITPSGVFIVPVDAPDEATSDGLWIWEESGLLVAATLSTQHPEFVTMADLLLRRIDPVTGLQVGSATQIPTGLFNLRPFTSTSWYALEETGEGLFLRAALLGDPDPQVIFEAKLAGGVWTFDETPRDPDDYHQEPKFQCHGWWVDDNRVLDQDSEVFIGSLIPPFNNYRYAVMGRRFHETTSPILLHGLADGHPTSAYDLVLLSGDPPAERDNAWWEGQLQDDGWSPAWGSGTLPEAIIPSLPGDGTVVITNPADPDDPWAWATLPPGAGLNDWMAFYVDGDWVQVHYGGRVVLVWRMPPSVYQHFLAGGASMGFYNSYTKEWQAEPPPGWPPAKPAPLNGWAYLVDSRHRVSETGDRLTRYGTRIDADDVLVFPGDYALVGQALQDDVIQSAPIKHIAGRDLPEVVLSRDDALLVWDAGYGHYLYPVEEAP